MEIWYSVNCHLIWLVSRLFVFLSATAMSLLDCHGLDLLDLFIFFSFWHWKFENFPTKSTISANFNVMMLNPSRYHRIRIQDCIHQASPKFQKKTLVWNFPNLMKKPWISPLLFLIFYVFFSLSFTSSLLYF